MYRLNLLKLRAPKTSKSTYFFFHLLTIFPVVLDTSRKVCMIHSIDLLLNEVLVIAFLLLSVHSYQSPAVPEVFFTSKDLKPTAKMMALSTTETDGKESCTFRREKKRKKRVYSGDRKDHPRGARRPGSIFKFQMHS